MRAVFLVFIISSTLVAIASADTNEQAAYKKVVLQQWRTHKIKHALQYSNDADEKTGLKNFVHHLCRMGEYMGNVAREDLSQAEVCDYKKAIEEQWRRFKERHGKKYQSEDEERIKLKTFMVNTHKIAFYNENRNRSYTLAMNEFGAMLHEDFKRIMNGFRKPKDVLLGANEVTNRNRASTFLPPHAQFLNLPRNIDWREQGYVTPVKNQGQCGSCWSFSATGALEGQHFKKTGKLVSLSEQNLVDCSRSFGNNGCEGGLMDYAFQYIKANDGIDTEKTYPYEAKDDKCRFNRTNVGADDTGFVDVKSGDEQQLAIASATVGPISVAIDASHESFQFYHQGVYDEPDCSSESLDHGVLLVGYGEMRVRFRTKKYWLVKNSWGETWGEQGYIKMARNHNNLCGIATSASYPLV